MNNRNIKLARILTLIPIVVFVVAVVCLGFAMILEAPSGRGTLYTVFALTGILSIFLSPLPCLVISIVGTVFAAKAEKEGYGQARIFLVIGICEIIACVMGVILACIMLIGGQGV